ncbi:MAG: hypothetical protein AAGJ18_30160, partial [Bacteroidota bacterium]
QVSAFSIFVDSSCGEATTVEDRSQAIILWVHEVYGVNGVYQVSPYEPYSPHKPHKPFFWIPTPATCAQELI